VALDRDQRRALVNTNESSGSIEVGVFSELLND
jgi:hypothetical protein